MSDQVTANDLPEQILPERPNIVGLFGLPRCWKPWILKQLSNNDDYSYFEIETEIWKFHHGGVEGILAMSDAERIKTHTIAMKNIQSFCQNTEKPGIVVAGSFSHWQEEDKNDLPLKPALSNKQIETFTNIVYLFIDPEILAKRRKDDDKRVRRQLSVKRLR